MFALCISTFVCVREAPPLRLLRAPAAGLVRVGLFARLVPVKRRSVVRDGAAVTLLFRCRRRRLLPVSINCVRVSDNANV